MEFDSATGQPTYRMVVGIPGRSRAIEVAEVEVADVPNALRRLAEAQRAAHAIPVVGITGNAGKTTAKQAAAATLGTRYRVLSPAASYMHGTTIDVSGGR